MNIAPIRLHSANFKSYNKLDSKTGLSASTSFYHDFPVLKKSAEIIEKEFPNGTDILIYAGSNGEEALSTASLLKDPKKYNIFSIDIFKEAVDFAKRGIYGIHPLAEDGFLINKNKTNGEKYLTSVFYKNFKETKQPKESLDNLTDMIFSLRLGSEELFPQKYFSPQDSIKRNVHFIEGDIRDISALQTPYKKAGAIFFRNALYHITQNDLTGVMKYGDSPNLTLNKQQVLDDLVKRVYDKLDIGGIFVLGSHLQEHLYIADKSVPQDKTVIADRARNIRYMSYPPHIMALNKIGGFKPLFEAEIKGIRNSIKLPLIWQKVK